MLWCSLLVLAAGILPLARAQSAYGVQTSFLTAAILYPDAPTDQTFVISYDDTSLVVDAQQGFPQEVYWPALTHSDLEVTITPSVDPPFSFSMQRKTLPSVTIDGWAFVQEPRTGVFQFSEASFPCLEELSCHDFALQLRCTNCDLAPDPILYGNFSSLMEQLEGMQLIALDTRSTVTLNYRLTDTLNKVTVQDTVLLEVYSPFTGLLMHMPGPSQMRFRWDPITFAIPYTSAEMPSITLQCSADEQGTQVIFAQDYDIAAIQALLAFDGPFLAPIYCSLRLTQPGWKDGPSQSFDMSNLHLTTLESSAWRSALTSPRTKAVLVVAIIVVGLMLVRRIYSYWASSRSSSPSIARYRDAGLSPEFAEVHSATLLRACESV